MTNASKKGGLVHAVGECTICGEKEDYYLKVREWARKHVEETRHIVTTEEGMAYTYSPEED